MTETQVFRFFNGVLPKCTAFSMCGDTARGEDAGATADPGAYAAFIIGYVIQARIPMPRSASPSHRDDDTAKE
jgi:hypothetical protein